MKIIKLITFVSALALLGGCASTGGYSAEEPSTEAHKQRLAERVLAYWKHMEKQEWEKVYDYYDPFMRAQVTRVDYARSRAKEIHYYDPKVGEIKIRGRIADVKVPVDVEIKDLVVAPGRVQSGPRTPRQLEVRWLWIDGDWYAQFVGPQGITFAQY